MSTNTVDHIFTTTPMRKILRIPAEVLDQAMANAYALFRADHLDQAEILCKGLLAADHRYWWAYSLYAATLQKLGRFDEALVQITRGLRFEPGQPKLLTMRAELLHHMHGSTPLASAASHSSNTTTRNRLSQAEAA